MVRIGQYQDMIDNVAEEEYKFENYYAPYILLKEAYQYLISDCRKQLYQLQREEGEVVFCWDCNYHQNM
jgi:hypothetical protein